MERKDGTILEFHPAIPQRFCFEPGYVLQVGPTSSLKVVSVSSFSVAVDGNVNKPLHLECVTSAVHVPRIT